MGLLPLELDSVFKLWYYRYGEAVKKAIAKYNNRQPSILEARLNKSIYN